MTPLYLSIPVLFWLSVCAWFDWKSRWVSNWLTLPVLGVAVIVRSFGYGLGDWRFVWLLSILVILGWAASLVGGADAKASLAMIFLDPRLAIWAWVGGVLWYFAFIGLTRRREKPICFPGMLGFAIGVFAYTMFNLLSIEAK